MKEGFTIKAQSKAHFIAATLGLALISLFITAPAILAP